VDWSEDLQRALESDDPAERLDDDGLDGLIRYVIAVRHSRLEITSLSIGSVATVAIETEDSIELATYVNDIEQQLDL
jgi:hypothetical protein